MTEILIYHLLNVYIFFVLQDFRTPKPAVLCSSSAKLCSTKVHEIALSLDDDGTGGGTSSINCCSESEPIGLTNSYRCKIKFCFPPFIYHQDMQIS